MIYFYVYRESMVWPWEYSIWQIAGFELAHGIFSALCALLVSWPAAYWIWTTYHIHSESTLDISHLNSEKQFRKAVICMALLSLGVGLCAHVLEDIYIGWF